jgi:halocyanin-like protein
MSERSRRRFVGRLGLLATVAGVAGCLGGGAGTSDDTTGETPSVESYLSRVKNYDGSPVDRTGRSSVTVTVGARGNGGYLAFSPAAVAITPGTTVVWEWTGKGGQHDVVAEHGAGFESDLVAAAGHTFEHAFEAPGPVLYYCTPHARLGMKGAVLVTAPTTA